MASEASAGLSAVSSIMGGRAQARALKTEGVMLEAQAKGVDLQAKQASERRREDLRASMAAYIAQRSARGLSLDSPSAVAIERELTRQSVRDEGVERLGYINQAGALRMSAAAKRRAGSNANFMGYWNAAGTLMDAAGDAMAAGGGGGSQNMLGKSAARRAKGY
ncbi:hypothetical protein ACFPIF_15500 [Brevundimonas faecalis]|uniref:hypothetical protein n=1 Tax=Brevundimonas faecalis TaxID=947378 RepID=UPI003610A510